MRPIRVVQDSVGSTVIPANFRAGPYSVVATPNSGNYDVAYTVSDIYDTDITPNWIDVTDMSAATAQVAKEVGTATAFRLTLNSGTSVTVEIAQSDV